MKQLFGIFFAGMFAIFSFAGQGTVMAQTRVDFKSTHKAGVVKYQSRRKLRQRRYARGPRRLNSEIYYRQMPRRSKKARTSLRDRRLRIGKFSGGYKQRKTHVEHGYYSYKNWPTYYKKHYGYVQPSSPHFGNYFSKFNDGHFSGYFRQ